MESSDEIFGIKKGRELLDRYFSLLLVFLTAFLVLFPYTGAGFIGDDAQLSTQQGLISMGEISIQSYTYDGLINWMMNGRLFPTTVLASVLQWQIIQTPLAYHLFASVLILLALGIFYKLILVQTNRHSTAQIALLITLACFQARDYHDPILSYHPLMDLVTIGLLLSFLFFIQFLRFSSSTDLRRSFSCFLITLLSYEVGVPFAIVFPILVWFVRPQDRSALLKSLGFIVLSLLYVVVSAVLRNKAPSIYNGIGFGSLHDYFAAFIYQTTSVLPLISFVAPPWWKIVTAAPSPSLFQLLLALITGICGALSLSRILRSTSPVKRGSIPFAFFVIPLSLLFIPPAVLALSGKYQFELRWGLGYLPVYLQAFGFGSLLAPFLQHRGALLQSILPTIFGLILAATSLSNSRMVDYRNLYWKDQRSLIQNALENNFFQDLPEKTALYIINKALWDVPAFYFQHGKIRVNCLDWKTAKQTPLPPYYLLHYKITNSLTKEGELVLEKFSKNGTSEQKRFFYSPKTTPVLPP